MEPKTATEETRSSATSLSAAAKMPPQVCSEILAPGVVHHPEEVPRVVDLAALPRCSLEVAQDGGLQTRMVV
jgi:hypothetical protein